MTMPTPQDLLNSGGGKSATFDTLGRTYKGRVTDVRTRQSRDFMTGEPETWDDGSPKIQLVITLATDERDPADPNDDGARSVYIKWWGVFRDQLTKALDAAGQGPGRREVQVGATLTATYTRDEPSKVGSPSKIIEYTYTPPQAADVAGLLNGTPVAPAATPAPAAPVAAPVAAPAEPAAGPPIALIKQLTAAGMTPAQIAPLVPGYPAEVVAVLATM